MSGKHICYYRGCSMPATCLPRLYVPAHKLSANAATEDVSALLGLPFCDRHFALLRAAEFLMTEKGQVIRDSVTAVFRERNAVPDFDRAVIGRVSQRDLDFGRFEQLRDRARAN